MIEAPLKKATKNAFILFKKNSLLLYVCKKINQVIMKNKLRVLKNRFNSIRIKKIEVVEVVVVDKLIKESNTGNINKSNTNNDYLNNTTDDYNYKRLNSTYNTTNIQTRKSDIFTENKLHTNDNNDNNDNLYLSYETQPNITTNINNTSNNIYVKSTIINNNNNNIKYEKKTLSNKLINNKTVKTKEIRDSHCTFKDMNLNTLSKINKLI